MPISLHIDAAVSAFGRATPAQYADLPGMFETQLALAGPALGEQLCHLMFSGLFDRYPELPVVLAESGVGWIPYLIDRLDDMSMRMRGAGRMRNERAPSEIARTQVFATFERDHAGMLTRSMWGVDNVMWASDYPHLNSTFPESRRVLDELFEDVPDSERRKMTCDTVAELYGFGA
jgi:predicted TIM-barrel fold metal-dependent hydrolase